MDDSPLCCLGNTLAHLMPSSGCHPHHHPTTILGIFPITVWIVISSVIGIAVTFREAETAANPYGSVGGGSAPLPATVPPATSIYPAATCRASSPETSAAEASLKAAARSTKSS